MNDFSCYILDVKVLLGYFDIVLVFVFLKGVVGLVIGSIEQEIQWCFEYVGDFCWVGLGFKVWWQYFDYGGDVKCCIGDIRCGVCDQIYMVWINFNFFFGFLQCCSDFIGIMLVDFFVWKCYLIWMRGYCVRMLSKQCCWFFRMWNYGDQNCCWVNGL